MVLLKPLLKRLPKGRSVRRLGLAFCLAFCLAGGLPPGWAAAAEPPADLAAEIKAALLFNFAKFVEWPAEAFPDLSAPMTFCVYGEDSVGAGLEALIRGETLSGRRLAVRRLRDLQQVRECHLLFVSAAEKGRVSETLAALRDARVLTVGEGADFLGRGGMIRLFLEQNRMRFDINLDAAEKSGLKISSKLLRLAQAVNPQRRGG